MQASSQTGWLGPSGNEVRLIDTTARSRWLFWALAALFWLALKAPYLSSYCSELDTANYVLGAEHFDPEHSAPQPPGFPLWILLLRGLAILGVKGPVAVLILAVAFCLAALLIFHRCARDMLGDDQAVFLTLLLAFCPTVLLYSVSASIYAVDLCFSVLIGWLCWRIWSGDPSQVLQLCVWTAIGLGVRQSGLVFLVPLVAISVAIGARRRPARAMLAVVLAGAICAAWFVPVTVMSGGYAHYSEVTRAHMIRGFRLTSPWFGASWADYAAMLERAAAFLMVALGGLAAATLTARRSRRQAGKAPACTSPWFWVLWIGPYGLFLLLIHFYKPGYFCILLPPVFLLAGSLIARREPSPERSSASAFGKPLVAGLAVSLGLALTPWPWALRAHFPGLGQYWREATLPAAADVLRRQQVIDGLLHSVSDPSNTLLIATRDYYDAPVRVTLPSDFKDALSVDASGSALAFYRGGHYLPLTELPEKIDRILMICWPGDQPPVTDPAGTEALSVYWDSGMRIYSMQLASGDHQLLVRGNSGPACPLHRPPQAMIGRLVSGFSALEGEGTHSWRWALGPSSEIRVALQEGQTANLVLGIASTIHPDQQILVSNNGDPAGNFTNLKSGQIIRIPLPAGTSSNLRIRYSIWNGEPRVLVANDLRPMAVRMSRIAVEGPNKVLELLP